MHVSMTITYFIVCDWHVQFSLFFKCSVSCGIGIQVRKIDCVLPVSVNRSHPDHLHSRNTAVAADDNNNNEKNDRIQQDAASNGPIDESIQILSNEQISMGCDPKLKPIATQSCTTGIECTTIINDNIDSGSSSHEEPDTITNENENDNGNENVNSNPNENENDNTDLDNDDENTSQESDNVEGPEDMGPGQNVFEASVEATDEHAEEDAEGNTENVSAENGAAAESEEVDETEVFFWENHTHDRYFSTAFVKFVLS